MTLHAERNYKRFFIRGLIGFCLAFILFVVLISLLLKQGMSFNSLTVGNISISQCTLTWKAKLELQIDTLTIGKVDNAKRVKSDISHIRQTIDISQRLTWLLSKVNINNLVIGEQSLAVNLDQKDETSYTLNLTTENTDFQSLLTLERDALLVDIIEAANKPFNSRFSGQIKLDAKENNSKGTLTALINDSFPVTIDIVADSDQFAFKGHEAGTISEITSLVDLFGLDSDIQVWITEYLSGSRYHLKSFKGHFPWDAPEVILDSLEAEVRVTDTEYTFAPGLEPIKAEYTDVFFSRGILTIKPHNKTFYGQDGGDSWLDINFNDPDNIILTAYIKTHAVLNDDILTLLNYYSVPLPFKQVGGITDTDLRLTINLNTVDVEAEGTFIINEGLVLYDGTVYTLSDARILLVNTDVTLERLKVAFEDLFAARVKGLIQAQEGAGNLDISLEKLNLQFGDSALTLDTSAEPTQLNYQFDSQGNMLEAGTSSWKLNSKAFTLGSFRTPFFVEDLSMELPPVPLDIQPGERAEISGFLSIKKKKADITYNILKYHVNDLELVDPYLSVDIGYDQELVLRTKETAHFTLGNIPLTVHPSEYRLDDTFFTIDKSRISYGSFFDTLLHGAFNYHLNEGTLYLERIDVTDEDLESNLQTGNETLVEIRHVDDRFIFNSPELGLWIAYGEKKNWSASFKDLSALYSRSKLLQKLKITSGQLAVSSSENGSRPYIYSAEINSPYQLLMDGDKKIEKLSIRGKLTDDGVTASINEKLRIDYDDKQLRVNASNIGFDISELIKLIKDRPQSTGNDQDKDDDIQTLITAENTFLYLSPHSRILADQVELEYFAHALKMNMSHGPGSILVEMNLEDEVFLVESSGLNDLFTGALIQSSIFNGGQMSIAAKGTFDEISILVQIEDTLLRDLKTVNNIMALLNTVPALITFSMPQYNLKGLPVTYALVGMKFKDKVATFESMDIKSPSLEATGTGWIDFSQRLMELDVNLTTQRKINIRKIPIGGYILHGEEGETSATIKVTGDVDDPEVQHTIFKEILRRPFKVLVNILKLPSHLVKKMRSESDIDKQADPSAD